LDINKFEIIGCSRTRYLVLVWCGAEKKVDEGMSRSVKARAGPKFAPIFDLSTHPLLRTKHPAEQMEN
jgi:hypothetical protein